MSRLPFTWSEAPIGSVCVETEQVTPESEVEFTYVDIGSVDRFTKKITSPQRLLGKDAPSRARKQIRAGDTIVSTTRPNLNAVALVDESLDGQIASTGFEVLRAPGLDPRWLGYLVRTSAFVDAMTSLVQGALYPAVRGKDVRSFVVPIAPRNEQKRIADKLDTVLTRVDAVSTRLARVAPLLKRFRQSVLAAATSGRLTDDWRRNLGRLSATEGLPPQWQAASIATAATNQDNLRRPISEVERRERQGAFNYYGASGVIDTIDGFTHEGDFLLIGEDGANLLTRSKPIAFRASGRIWVNNHAHVLTHPSIERLTYLSFAINAIDLSPWVTGSAQPKLTRKAMDLIPVPLPPEDEQAEIVRRVDVLFAFADRLEGRLQTAQTATERLTPALLAKAFRGELVPQDPNDEPASELLRRLQAASGHRAPARAAGRGRQRSI